MAISCLLEGNRKLGKLGLLSRWSRPSPPDE